MADELAAVVMAAGLGTRMKSATPKHLHPLLGRSIVDWVITPRATRAWSGSSSSRRRDGDLLEGVEVAVQEKPLGTGDAVRSARGALEGAAVTSSSSTGRPGAHARDVARARRDAPRERRRRHRALLRAADAARTAASSRDGDGRLARIVEAADASPRSSRSARSTPASTSSTASKLWPRSTGSSRTTPRASST